MLRFKEIIAIYRVNHRFNFAKSKIKFASFINDYQRLATICNITLFQDINLNTPLPIEINFSFAESKRGAAMPLSVSIKTFFPFVMDDLCSILQSKADFNICGLKRNGIAEMGINPKNYDISINSTC